MAKGLTYKDAGVDIEAGDRLVEEIRSAVRRTHGPRVLDLYGHFAGIFSLDYNQRLFRHNYRHPLLVAGTDGVGTKLRVAIDAGRYRTVGQDCVAMCVNDVLVLGAEPLFFLDYVGVGRLDERVVAEVVIGVAEACRRCDCALLGGETAEMAGFYAPGDFDLVGFALGVVEKKDLVTGARIERGDVVLGLASSGLHSNGYTLARTVVFDVAGLGVGDAIPGVGRTVADELLEPTRLYAPAVVRVLRYYSTKRVVHGMAHITGGGLAGNLERILPPNVQARIDKKAWPVPPIFEWLQKAGGIGTPEMRRVFNMGIGFVMVVSPYYADNITRLLEREGETVYRLGTIAAGKGEVALV
ncbi:MAG: phosphoribosylformylglycinamidine cyclo-ligase [Planctomycetes bacterium]|nr:phosphoribosylformylglycinamidine cyclo-ligase [Planctomycetota bacterium]